jgi:hypothetical protein
VLNPASGEITDFTADEAAERNDFLLIEDVIHDDRLKDGIVLAEDRLFPRETQSAEQNAGTETPQSEKPYRVGDEVYLDDEKYRIKWIMPGRVTLSLIKMEARKIIDLRDFKTEEFERLYRNDPRNFSGGKDISPNPEEESKARPPVPVGQNVLLPTVYDENGNFNRDGKRRRVTAAEPIGKYQIYTTKAVDSSDSLAWVMTASGRLMQWGTLNHWNTNENAIDQAFANAAWHVEESLNAPDQWTDYNSAAIVNRLNEADAHNAPIREARAARYEEENAARSEAREREARAREESFKYAVDEIGGALIRGERVDIPQGFDKNPLLALFDLYEIDVPLRTKGWIVSARPCRKSLPNAGAPLWA